MFVRNDLRYLHRSFAPLGRFKFRLIIRYPAAAHRRVRSSSTVFNSRYEQQYIGVALWSVMCGSIAHDDVISLVAGVVAVDESSLTIFLALNKSQRRSPHAAPTQRGAQTLTNRLINCSLTPVRLFDKYRTLQALPTAYEGVFDSSLITLIFDSIRTSDK